MYEMKLMCTANASKRKERTRSARAQTVRPHVAFTSNVAYTELITVFA